MKKNNLLFLLSLCTIILFTQCKDDPEKCSADDTESVRGCTDSAATNYNESAECDDNSCEYGLTQESLNSTSQLAIGELTGGFAHGGSGVETIREVFTTDGSVAGETISPGYAITKHTYAKDSLGNKGDLLVIFAMLKHGEGYWDDTNDWEYIRIPADPTVDYTVNPNGILANAAVSGNVHDENPGCVDCHNGAGGGDQLFSND